MKTLNYRLLTILLVGGVAFGGAVYGIHRFQVKRNAYVFKDLSDAARKEADELADEGDMDKATPGSKRIVEVLLDDSDPRPVWLQAWGGPNTIARALKTIEEERPERMTFIPSSE